MKMKMLFLVPVFVLFASLFLFGSGRAGKQTSDVRAVEPVVSTDWLEANLTMENLVILDIRSSDDYEDGHIPGSINEPFPNPFATNWVVSDPEGLWLELPETEALLETIGSLGITRDSLVVIATAPNPGEPPFYGLANATRVAMTLICAGVKNVAILDGGYPKWLADFPDETDRTPTSPVGDTYYGNVNKSIFVSRQYVKKRIQKAEIIDARDADVYFGVTIEPFAEKAGHIPEAKSLPAPWIWQLDEDDNYVYKDAETLSRMASGVLGESWGPKAHLDQEVIVYCGVGGYASSWWFVLTQVLGYQNIKVYDGSAQEWVLDYDMIPYQWD